MPLPAYCVFQVFGREIDSTFTFDRHYLLYAARGTMRLEAGGRAWSLPPSRAALIRAGEAIRVTIPSEIQCCSALFDPAEFAAPEAGLTVFEMTPLARELILECRSLGPDLPELPADGLLMLHTLAMLAAKLAQRPSPAWIAAPRSPEMRRALEATEASLGDDSLAFGQIADAARVTPRTLARRFAEEIGMPWSQARQRLRMIRATERLADTDLPVTEIALQVGYASSSAFNAAFRAFAGTTPSTFRASARPG